MQNEGSRRHREWSLAELLLTLTIQGRIPWQDHSAPGFANTFEAVYKGLYLRTEWLQDDRPRLWFYSEGRSNDEVLIEGYLLVGLIDAATKYCHTKNPMDDQPRGLLGRRNQDNVDDALDTAIRILVSP